METPDTIHTFWFGTAADDATVIAQQSTLWWSKGAAVDAEIRHRFEALVGRAASGALDGWLASARGRLALVLLTDQFPRNIWRGDAHAFAFDTLALGWSKAAIRDRVDRVLRPIERVFLYLPLEHAEDRADQADSVHLFAALAAQVGPELRPAFDGFVDFARRHQQIIDRFGRFPHRNGALGRRSTADETAFLQQPGAGF